ncbi:MAG: CheR family methyltransferase [Candidatus Margulisiibacteriota bacterium]
MRSLSFPVVGIGGSAGGLEAFEQLLNNLPAKTGLAYVFIMHLAPGHKSLLSELLSRDSKMPVIEVRNNLAVQKDHVYVIPPNTMLSLNKGKLKLTRRKPSDTYNMPIDYFFRSLAKELGSKSIGVILSGTATDGTLGAEAIKAEGGITFAQDLVTAKYPGMPQSAITGNCVDMALPPKKIAAELVRIARHPFISSAGQPVPDRPAVTTDKPMEAIFNILRTAKGTDFLNYKTTTISRRISRRMVLHKISRLKDYARYLREHKDEVNSLYEDLLINVTSFFRDPKVFNTLKKLVIPAILKNKGRNQEVRIWVPGCSSGEEAYSIAICLTEAMTGKTKDLTVRIFATDISDASIDRARQGIFSKHISRDVSPERLKRFFVQSGNSYKIAKQLREMCVFSRQNIFSDPPFSNIDLISCRNLLIYFQPILQKIALQKFHYSLRPDGFLLLGSSESSSGYTALFKTLDQKNKIFTKKHLAHLPAPGMTLDQSRPGIGKKAEKPWSKRPAKETDIENLVNSIVMNKYSPCGVLIDSNMDVVRYMGHTGRYLESASGKPSHNIFKLARGGLFLPLRAAISKAKKTGRTAKKIAQDIRLNKHKAQVSITVIPVKPPQIKEVFYLLLFEEIGRSLVPGKGAGSINSNEQVQLLQKELMENKEYLQTVIAEQENAYEEIKTANEEILSSNEELQSTNEEMETAKEELQASNEELITMNEELQNRNAEVSVLNNDLTNLLGSINMPVVMLGTDLVIRRLTAQTEKTLNLVPSDIGRPIGKIKLSVDIPDLEEHLHAVIETLRPKTLEINDRDNNWYIVYIKPYRTLDNKIDGVIMIFVNNTNRKKLENELKKINQENFKNLFENAGEGIIVADPESKKFKLVNKAICKMLDYTPEELLNKGIMDIHPKNDLPYVLDQFKRQAQGEFSLSRDMPVKKKDGSVFYADVNATTVTFDNKTYMAGFFHDTTEQKLAMQKKASAEAKAKFTLMVSHELRSPVITITQGIDRILNGKTGEITEETKNALNTAKTTAERLERLISNVLKLQQIEAKKLNFDIVENDLNATTQEVCSVMGILAREKELELVFMAGPDIPRAKFDKDKIVQVITNLLSNAIKFTQTGIITVTTSLDNGMAQVSVRDTGMGIKTEDMGRLFQAFGQLEGNIGKKMGGTGLGLAISKEIITAHHGRIWAESEPGKGSVFYFTLPLDTPA